MRADQIIRTGHTKRWTIVRTHRDQTLSEHLAQVALFTMVICDRLNFLPIEKYCMIQYALLHDVEEIDTGDIPNPYKHRFSKESLDIVPVELTALVHARDPGPLGRATVKLADLLESLLFIKVEGLGPHAEQVANWMHKLLDEHVSICSDQFPKYAWGAMTAGLIREVYPDGIP